MASSSTDVPPFTTATAIIQTSHHTYTAHFHDAWCIGSVPQGGYVTSAIQRVASLHFGTTLSKQNQPDCMILHLEFMRRTSVGPVEFLVEDLKLGAQTSTIRILLRQRPSKGAEPRDEVFALLTHSNLRKESGVSLDTKWSLLPAPAPGDVKEFEHDTDPNWALETDRPFPDFRKASSRVRWLRPRTKRPFTNFSDQWVGFDTFEPGSTTKRERWTNDRLGFLADMFPQLVNMAIESGLVGTDALTTKQFWFPTLVLNLDVKKALPDEGVEYLFQRVRTKSIRNGRYDLEVIILDESGDLVAQSHHVVLAIDAKRNLQKRGDRKGGKL